MLFYTTKAELLQDVDLVGGLHEDGHDDLVALGVGAGDDGGVPVVGHGVKAVDTDVAAQLPVLSVDIHLSTFLVSPKKVRVLSPSLSSFT